MRRRVPLNAVRAFEAAARHQSLVRAADELCVTPTAISHQVRLLEEFLQFRLFLRKNSRLELTPDSRACLNKLTEALDLIDDALMALRDRDEIQRRIMVAASASLVSFWLMPRIGGFMHLEPEIDVVISSFVKRTFLDVENTDISICNWQTTLDRRVEPLMEEEIIPVCAPSLAEHYGDLTADSLRYLPLIHVDRTNPTHNGTYPDWERYLREYGIRRNDTSKGARFNLAGTAIDAAKTGMGALLGRSILIESALERGELVRIGEPYPVRSPYFVVSDWQPSAPGAVNKFKDWLFSNAQATPGVHIVN